MRRYDLIVAIHQPHYFPWLGYLDKMVSADLFVILDDVQMNVHSPIRRNNFLETNGKIASLAVSTATDRSEMKPIKVTQIHYRSEWNNKHRGFLLSNYKKHKYFDQIWPHIGNIFNGESETIFDLDMKTIFTIRELFDIKTALIYQSSLNYDRAVSKNELLVSILKDVSDSLTVGGGGIIYLSGQGAKKYMIPDQFIQEGIDIRFQEFVSPVYPQKNSKEFVPNLSSLDYLFNCGIEQARKLFLKQGN
jgi:hypothetical protein